MLNEFPDYRDFRGRTRDDRDPDEDTPSVMEEPQAGTTTTPEEGVFITTSRFSREAREYANSVTPRVVLIGGKQITDLMIAHNVGVTVRQTYEPKRLDTDYFDEES